MKIKQTHNTPYIFLDKQNCQLILKGKSYPENAGTFYNHINKEIIKHSEYMKNSIITVEFFIEILNSTSSTCIYRIFKELHNLYKKTIINWYCEKDDEDMIEQASVFQSSFSKIEFNIITVEDIRKL